MRNDDRCFLDTWDGPYAGFKVGNHTMTGGVEWGDPIYLRDHPELIEWFQVFQIARMRLLRGGTK